MGIFRVMTGEGSEVRAAQGQQATEILNKIKHQILNKQPHKPDLIAKHMKSLKYVFLFCLVLVGFGVNAQFYARVSGSWNSPATWSSTPGGSAGTTVPGASDDVFTEGFSINFSGSTVNCNNLYVAYNVANGINTGISASTINIHGFLASYDKTIPDFATPTTSIIRNNSNLLNIYFKGTGQVIGSGNGNEGWGPNAPLRNIFFDPGSGSTASIPDLLVAASGSLTVVSGTLDVTGQLQYASGSASITVNSGTNLLVSTGNISGNGTVTSSFPTLINNGTITSAANTTSFINFTTITLNAGSTFNIGFNGVNQTEGWWYQTATPSSIVADQTSTVSYNSSTSQNVHAHIYGNLMLGGTGTLTKTVAGTGSVNIKGSLSFGNAGITLNVPAAIQTIFDGTNGQSINGNGTANFNGGLQTNKSAGVLTVSQNISIQNGLTLTSGEMVFGSNTINLSGNLVNNATLTSSSSTLNINGTTVVSGASVTNLYNLTIAGTGTLTPPATTLNVAGNFVNNGIFIPNNGTIGFNGISPQSITGTNSNFNNISVNSTSSITLSSAQNLTGALSMSAGNFNSNGNLTLVSNASGDARIAQITGGTISGSINVQRYIPTGTDAYRYIASPVTNATAAQWKSAFPITGTFTDASLQAEWPFTIAESVASAYLYNESSAQASLDDKYESFPADGNTSSGTPLVNGKGYAVYMYDPNQPTYTLTGTAKTGAANVAITAKSAGSNDGWNLVGNPYASPIDWDNVTIPVVMNDQVSIMDNTGTGGFVYYSQGVGTGSFSGIIASGQAFWVKTTSSTTLSFKEADKANVTSPSFFREGEIADLLRIKVKGNTLQDELALYFKEEAKDISEIRYDALKRTNPVGFINFSSFSSDGVKLAINAMGMLSCSKEVKLSVEGVTVGAYSFNFSNLASFKAGIEINLTDNLTGQTHAITSEESIYEFEVTSDENSYGANRFKIKFGYPGISTNLTVSGEDVCSGTDSKVNISNSQSGVTYFATLSGNTIGETILGNGENLNITIPGAALANGENQIVVMASNGECSAVALSQVSIITKNPIYTITSAKDAARCQAGAVTLSAEGAPANGSYRWYESSNPDVAIEGKTGAVFITPELSKSKSYLVSVVNSLGCEGAKKEVNATIANFDNATITEVGSTTLESNYETGNQWFLDGKLIAGATGKTVEVLKSGIYKLNVTVEGGCETSVEKEMIVTGLENAIASRQIYPNPVSDILSIKLPASNGEAIGLIQNELGQSVGHIAFTSVDDFLIGEFNFEEKMPGIYIVRITQGNSITNHKIVKK